MSRRDLVGVATIGIGAPCYRTRRGAHDNRGNDAALVQHLENPGMGCAKGAAAS